MEAEFSDNLFITIQNHVAGANGRDLLLVWEEQSNSVALRNQQDIPRTQGYRAALLLLHTPHSLHSGSKIRPSRIQRRTQRTLALVGAAVLS